MNIPTRAARLVHAKQHCELWNARKNAVVTHSIETFQWCTDGTFLIKTYYEIPEHVGKQDDPYAFLLNHEKQA